VKEARREAGLSLGQVAGDDVSRTAIYFVETGKSKPSMETLKLIAERTGKPLDYFLSRPGTLEARSSAGTAEIERLLATADYPGALVAGEALLSRERDREVVARTKHLMATAHLRLAQPVEGRRLAAAARGHFEQTGDMLMVAECLGSEASAAYLMQEPGALAIAEGALATCRGLNPVPRMTEARLLAILGSVHNTNQNWQAAIDCFEQATAAGDVVQDLRRLSLLYGELSRAHQEIGELGQAASYAQRALTIYETLNDRLSLARSENNLGLLYFKRGQPAQAIDHVERGLRLFEEAGVEIGKASFTSPGRISTRPVGTQSRPSPSPSDAPNRRTPPRPTSGSGAWRRRSRTTPAPTLNSDRHSTPSRSSGRGNACCAVMCCTRISSRGAATSQAPTGTCGRPSQPPAGSCKRRRSRSRGKPPPDPPGARRVRLIEPFALRGWNCADRHYNRDYGSLNTGHGELKGCQSSLSSMMERPTAS
jgi:tetratricopeptide (TPR) repeat protein